MPDVSRRQFLRTASLGAAATGVLASGAAGVLHVADAAASPLHLDAGRGGPPLDGSDIFAHVIDARSGQMTLFVGDQAIPSENTDDPIRICARRM